MKQNYLRDGYKKTIGGRVFTVEKHVSPYLYSMGMMRGGDVTWSFSAPKEKEVYRGFEISYVPYLDISDPTEVLIGEVKLSGKNMSSIEKAKKAVDALYLLMDRVLMNTKDDITQVVLFQKSKARGYDELEDIKTNFYDIADKYLTASAVSPRDKNRHVLAWLYKEGKKQNIEYPFIAKQFRENYHFRDLSFS